MITHMDLHMGRLIDHLKKPVNYNNKIIIYMTNSGPD